MKNAYQTVSGLFGAQNFAPTTPPPMVLLRSLWKPYVSKSSI